MRLIGHQALQASVLFLERLQALGIAHLQIAVLLLPVVERRLGDPVAAHQVAGVVFLQHRDDLLGGKAGLLPEGLLVASKSDRQGPVCQASTAGNRGGTVTPPR